MGFQSIIGRLKQGKQKAFSLTTIMIACAIMVLMASVYMIKVSESRATAKIAQMQTEMDAIVTACLMYETLNVNAELPATLEDLTSGLTAAQSIDKCPHNTFLAGDRDTTDGVKDPWGNDYNYSKTGRTLSCTPKDGSGNDLETITKEF